MIRQRLLWLDAAKGGAIVLVVLHHSIIHASAAGIADSLYGSLDHYLRQMRMPLFFIASGITTSFAINSTPSQYLTRKVLPICWILLVWTLILGLVFQDFILSHPFGADGVFAYVMHGFLQPDYGLWFVVAILWMSVLAYLVRDLPPWLVLTIAFVIAALIGFGLGPQTIPPLSDHLVNQVLSYGFFFFLGLYGRNIIVTFANRPRYVAVAFLVSAIVFVFFNKFPAGIDAPALFTRSGVLRSLAGATAGLCIAIAASRMAVIGEWLSWFGNRSLSIFVAHGLFLIPLAGWPLLLFADMRVAELVAPALLAALSIAGSLLLYQALIWLHMRWLYRLPIRI